MKEILNITLRLTISCLVAAVIMGSAFVITNKAKKHNAHEREQQVMYSLLGYGAGKPVPASVAMHQIYRYLVTEGGRQFIGYLVPSASGAAEPYTFVALDLKGELAWQKPVAGTPAKMQEKDERDKAIRAAIGEGKDITYADKTIVVTDHGKRSAYLVSGRFPGFKSFVSVMLAVDPGYKILGMAVLEQEEDPGLGAEIEQDYFKNQFKGKSLAVLGNLKVVKEPEPVAYQQALEGKVAPDKAAKVMAKYADHDIYALTGATISSRAVTRGVKGIVKKFAFRLDALDRVLQQQHIAVSF